MRFPVSCHRSSQRQPCTRLFAPQHWLSLAFGCFCSQLARKGMRAFSDQAFSMWALDRLHIAQIVAVSQVSRIQTTLWIFIRDMDLNFDAVNVYFSMLVVGKRFIRKFSRCSSLLFPSPTMPFELGCNPLHRKSQAPLSMDEAASLSFRRVKVDEYWDKPQMMW